MQYQPGSARATLGTLHQVAPVRISLTDIMQRYAGILRSLPCQEIDVRANDLGCERVCINTISAGNPDAQIDDPSVQLLFSIMAFDKRNRPVATLLLLENYTAVKGVELSLTSLDKTQGSLLAYFKQRNASVKTLTDCDQYLTVLRSLVEAVGSDIDWT